MNTLNRRISVSEYVHLFSRRKIYYEKSKVSTRAERVLQIKNELKVRVEQLTQLRKILEEPSCNGMELVDQYIEKYRSIKNLYPEEVINGVKVLRKLRKKKRLSNNDNKKIEDLERNASILFLFELEKGIELLKIKGGQFENERNKYYIEGEWVGSSKFGLCSRDLVFGENGEVEFEDDIKRLCRVGSYGLSLNHLYEEQAFRSVYLLPSIHGEWETGTIFCYIKEDGDSSGTIRHENIHNIYSAYKDQSIYYINFEDLLHKLREGKEESEEELEGDCNNFIDSLQGEIVANYEYAQKGQLFTEWKVFTDIISELERLLIMQKNKKYENFLEKVISIYYKQMLAFLDLYANILYIGNQLGINDDIKSLCIMFKPTQYRKIIRYLIDEYGKERINSLIEDRSNNNPDFFKLKIGSKK